MSTLLLQGKLSAVKRQLALFDNFVSGGEVTKKHRETLALLLRGAARLIAEMNAELFDKGDGDSGDGEDDGDGSSPSVVFVRGGSTVYTDDDADDDDKAIVIEDPMNTSNVPGDEDIDSDDDNDSDDDDENDE
jgi:hypothetical protein